MFTVAWLPPPVSLAILAVGVAIGVGYGVFLLLKTAGAVVVLEVLFVLWAIGMLGQWLESRSSRQNPATPRTARGDQSTPRYWHQHHHHHRRPSLAHHHHHPRRLQSPQKAARCTESATQYGIKMHLQSRIHRGEQVACPFCNRCFATATGVTHHLESSACLNAPSINRDSVYQLVRSKDPHGAISKKLLTWHGSDQYEATGRSWNGYAYECYFCHREFNQLNSLNQHLKSPAHQQDLYHCPNGACRLDFKTLASVINHLESESCGFMRFETVQRQMGNVLGSDRLLTF